MEWHYVTLCVFGAPGKTSSPMDSCNSRPTTSVFCCSMYLNTFIGFVLTTFSIISVINHVYIFFILTDTLCFVSVPNCHKLHLCCGILHISGRPNTIDSNFPLFPVRRFINVIIFIFFLASIIPKIWGWLLVQPVVPE